MGMGFGRTRGFTIVELLIVIVVITILAAITIVAYNGIQGRARDARRQNDVAAITQALELYYLDNGKYPTSSGSTAINVSWSTTADSSWPNLVTQLRPYISNLPTDPISTAGAGLYGGYDYSYYSDPPNGGNFCGTTNNQMYILVYKQEGAAQKDNLQGDCTTTPIYYAGLSNYRVRK